MKENKKFKLLALIMILAVMSILPTGCVKASLQANQNTQYTKGNSATNWIKAIREMELAGEAMGLSETLNEDLTASSNSNGIDVHMVRTTEYGAMAILSASGYGNPSNARAITTSTGNKTGIILNTNQWEWTAGGLQGRIFSGRNSKYFDSYSTNNDASYDYNTNKSHAKVGDGLGDGTTLNIGTVNWHSAGRSSWVRSGYPYFVRGYDGIFSFDSDYADDNYYARATAICGEGL